MRNSLGFSALFILLLFSETTNATTIKYSNTLVSVSPSSFTAEASLLLGAPSTNYAVFTSATAATYGNYHSSITYNTSEFLSFLGVSQGIIDKTDFIAFDANNGGSGFEDSIWTFDDGSNSLTHIHNYLDLPNGPVVANIGLFDVGDIYNSLFGTSFSSTTDIGVILFDLSDFGIDTSASNFQVTLQGGGTSCGTECPDVMQMGVVSRAVSVPAPPTLLLLSVGVVAVFARYKVSGGREQTRSSESMLLSG